VESRESGVEGGEESGFFGWLGRGTHNRDPGSSGPMKREGDATRQGAGREQAGKGAGREGSRQGVDMDYGVSFQHLTLLGADGPSRPGDLIFSSENPASWPSCRGDPRQFLLDSGRASAAMSEGTNHRTRM
jgi:hypothetical protein